MIAHRDPAGAFSMSGTVADDCVQDFLGDIDETLWILRDAQRSDQVVFRHARRKREHVEELRRLLGRLHRVLVEWEDQTRAG